MISVEAILCATVWWQRCYGATTVQCQTMSWEWGYSAPRGTNTYTHLNLFGLSQLFNPLNRLVEWHLGEESVRPVLHPAHEQIQVVTLEPAPGEGQLGEGVLHDAYAARAAQPVAVQLRLRPRHALLLRFGVRRAGVICNEVRVSRCM